MSALNLSRPEILSRLEELYLQQSTINQEIAGLIFILKQFETSNLKLQLSSQDAGTATNIPIRVNRPDTVNHVFPK